MSIRFYDPEAVVYCCYCEDEHPMDLTHISARVFFGTMVPEIRRRGWLVYDRNSMLCPECIEAGKEDALLQDVELDLPFEGEWVSIGGSAAAEILAILVNRDPDEQAPAAITARVMEGRSMQLYGRAIEQPGLNGATFDQYRLEFFASWNESDGNTRRVRWTFEDGLKFYQAHAPAEDEIQDQLSVWDVVAGAEYAGDLEIAAVNGRGEPGTWPGAILEHELNTGD